jgi:hypothetical protein
MKILQFVLLGLLALVPVTPPAAAVEKEAESTGILAVHVNPEDGRAEKLSRFLGFYGSPIAPSAEAFIQEADRFGLDWRLVAAIAGVESTFGKHVPYGSHNAWGWGIPTGAKSGIAFRSWEEGIARVSEGLRSRYYNRGAVTVEQVGRIYAASPHWASRVRFFLAKIDTFRPVGPGSLTVTL